MRIVLIIFLALFINTFAEEENIVSESNIIPADIQKDLDIKAEFVKLKTISISKKYPAKVRDDLTLSQSVYSPVNGLIKKLFVKEGDKVSKGQKLALIYSPTILKLQSELFLAEIKLKSAKKVFEREKELFEEKVTPYARYFEAKINYENAKGKVEALKKILDSYGELENGNLILRAQMDGYVAKQNVVYGDSVGITKLLFKIHSHETLWTVAFVPIEEVNLIKIGKKVKILSPIGETTGIIDFISHSVDPDTKRVEVRIISDNSNETLKPNMFVDVIYTGKNIKGLFVPASAVVFNEDKTYVFVKNGNEFNPVEIKIGKRIYGFYQILSGLKEGQEVVVKGTIHLKAKFFGEAEE